MQNESFLFHISSLFILTLFRLISMKVFIVAGFYGIHSTRTGICISLMP